MKTNQNTSTEANEVNEVENTKPRFGLRSLLFIALAALCLCASVVNSDAQTFYGIPSFTNNVTAPVLKSFQIQSFTAYVTIQPQTLTLTNISTNETYTASYSAGLQGLTGTNLVLQGSVTTNFNASLGFTNGGNATIAFPQVTYPVQVNPWGTFSNSGWPSVSRPMGLIFQ